jgi:hypothetical protein
MTIIHYQGSGIAVANWKSLLAIAYHDRRINASHR